MDGIIGNYYNTTFNGAYGFITNEQLDRRALEDPLFFMKVDTISATAGVIRANIKLKYLDTLNALNSSVIVHAALIEANVGTNRNVVRRLLPAADGIFVNQTWTLATDTVVVPINYTVDVPISDPTQLYLVAFVEGKEDKVIYQSVKFKVSKKNGRQIVGLPQEIIAAEIRDLNVYPNPASMVVNFQLDNKLTHDYQWEIIDQRGVTVLSGDLNRNLTAPQQVDISRLANEIYLVKIQTPNGKPMYRKLAVLNGNN
jgi:hypothetical protein